MKLTANGKPVAAEICIYGTDQAAGWMAAPADYSAILGTGEPQAGLSLSDAAWQAADALRQAGLDADAIVRIFAPNGCHANLHLHLRITEFGELQFGNVVLKGRSDA